ncbi:TPA: MFS transporter [Salmonella enterica subsp. enterica serovar Ball]|nr:MFS transporter [Salmonella enterica subsp. enterica serovar Ball]
MTKTEKHVVLISCLMLVIGLMAVDFFNPSLPYIMQSLQVSQNTTKTLIVAYMMTLGVAQFFYGRFSDLRGRKPAILIALCVAAVGLALSSLADSIAMLYLARMITAAGMAGCTVISRAVLVDVISDKKTLRQAFSYFAMSSQISPAFAPVMGGFIQQYWGWRYAFALFAVITLAALLVLLKIMQETHPQRHADASATGFSVYRQLLSDERFTVYSLASALIFVFTIGYYASTPFAFHQLGYSPVENSVFYLIYCAGILSGSWAMSSVLLRFTAETLYRGLLAFILLLCLVFLAAPGKSTSLGLWALFSFGLSFSCGVTAPLTLALSMETMETFRGMASALQGAIKMFFAGVFLALFDLVTIHDFISVTWVFLTITLLLWGCVGIEIIWQKRSLLR